MFRTYLVPTVARQVRRSIRFKTSGGTETGARLKPKVLETDKASTPDLNPDLIAHLERTSLVDFGSEEAQTRLRDAVQFADTLFEVDTTGVEPMTSVLDNTSLRLREDVCLKTNRKDILANASITEEDYFVSPPGNIPLEKK